MLSSPLLTSLITALATAQLQEVDGALRRTPATARVRSSADSVRAVRAVRRAQTQFEGVRRANLPLQPGQSRGPCDFRVGRLCYWHDDGEAEHEIPEPERIARARERLVAALDSVGRLVAGDEWVAGQRVRYLLEAGRRDAALAAATECRSSRWWCAALTGLALHQSQAFARADSAFAVALAAMPADQRCKWNDLSLFLDGNAAKEYRRLPCESRGATERRFWWLAQPLYRMAGNDLRTEFFARRTMARLEQQARSAYDLSWGSDVEELLMRFGWPTWWTREPPASVAAEPWYVIVGHEPAPSFYFHPSARLLGTAAADARPGDWQPTAKLPPARYAPAYAAGFAFLETQVALFRRGDSAVVVAAYEPPRDSLFREAAWEAALALGRDEVSPMTVVSDAEAGRTAGPLLVRAPWGPMLLSVELTAPATRGVARARFGIRPGPTSGRLRLSDLLLYEPREAAAATFEEAVREALGAPRVRSGDRVGVYWETYGVRRTGEPLSVMLTVERVGRGWGARAAERLGLARRVTPLRVRWQEVPAQQSGVAARSINVDLSALPPGRYRMQLRVAADDGSVAVAERELELTPAQ